MYKYVHKGPDRAEVHATADEIERYVYILAGDEMEILIFPEGNWRFNDET